MVVLKKFTSSEFTGLSSIQGRLLYDSTSNVLRFHDSQSYNNVLVFKDLSNNITNINSLTATNLTGTLQTAAQPNITSLGTLTSLSTGSLTLNGTAITATALELNKLSGVTATTTKLNYVDITTPGTAEASKAIILDSSRNITNINSLTSTNLTGTLQTAVQPNITSVGTLTSLSTGSLTLNGTAITSTAAEINKLSGVTATTTEINYVDVTTIGTAEASKALIIDSSRNITNINNLTAANLTGTLQTAAQPNITSVGTLTSLSTGNITLNGTAITATAAEINSLSGSTSTPTQLNYINITTEGIAEASKALVVNSSRDITNINALTATNLTGTLQTAAQPNITSVGTLTGLSTGSITLNGTAITATAAEINYLDITTIGTGQASKALILDSSRNIININSLTATNLTGTLQTAAQPNITSVGTLTSLSTNSLTLNGTAISATAAEINKLSGLISTTAELNYVDTTQGTAEASKALVLDASRNITNINNITITGLLSTTFQTVTLLSTYQSWTNNINTPVVSALKMGTTNAVLGTTSAHSFGLTTSNTERLSIGSTGIVSILNTTDSTNTTSGALLISGGVGIAKRAVIGTSLHVGDTYDTGRALSILKSVANNSEIYFVFGRENSNRNQFEFKFQYVSSSSTSNYGSFGIHTIGQMFILSANGNIGVYNTAPVYTFDVTGDINLTGSLRFGGVAITSTATELNYVDITTIGTGQASKALVLDASRNIININSLTATNLTGTLQTAAQPNITSLGTLTSLSTGSLTLGGTAITATAAEINYLDITTIGTGQASKALILDSSRDIININSLTAANLTGTLQTAAQPNITSVGTLTSLSTGSLTLGGAAITATASEINTLSGLTATTSELNYVDTTPGTAEASKALVLDSNLDIVGIHNIETDNLTVNGTLVTSSAVELNYVDVTTIGVAQASKALVLDANLDIVGIHNIETDNLTVNGTLITSSAIELNYVDVSSIGVAEASKALVVDTNRDITNINDLSATNLTGTLQTASQPNITSVGTLTSLSTGSLTLNGTTITSTAAEINILDGITSTTSELNSLSGSTSTSSDFNKLASISASAAEINILDGITSTTSELNSLSGSTATSSDFNKLASITATATEINILDGITSSTSELNSLSGSTATSSDFNKLASITATPTELNSLSNSTATSSDFNKLASVTATATELNTLDGITATTSELNTLDGITSTTTELNSLSGSTATSTDFNKLASITATSTEINILSGLMSSTAELNRLFGLTSTTTELNILSGITASTSELNTLDGITTTTSELNSLSGSSASSSDFNKLASITSTSTELNSLSGSTATSSDFNKLASITASALELNTLDGITATTSELNTLDGITATTSELNSLNGSTASSSDFNKLASVTATSTELNSLSGSNATSSDFNKLASITSTSTELNILDGITSTTSELNSLSGSTATSSDFNKLASITSTSTELNILDGITSTTSELNSLSGSTATSSDFNKLASITATSTELNILDGITTNTSELNSLSGSTATSSDFNKLASVTATSTELNKLDGLMSSTSELNILFGVTATSTELNKLSGLMTSTSELNSLSGANVTFSDFNKLASVTATSTELNKLSGLMSSTSELNILSGVTASASELNKLDGLMTSTSELNSLSGSTATFSDFNKLASVTATSTELNKLSGLMASTSELNILSGVTATSIELNKLDGLMASTSELNILSGVTASASELNKLDGLMASTSELNSLSGSTASSSDFNKLASVTATSIELNKLDGLMASTSELNILSGVTATSTELNKLDGLIASTSELNSLSGSTATSSDFNKLASVTASASELNSLSGSTATSSDFNKLASVTASASELNTLSGSTATSSDFNKLASVTASASELNTLSGSTATSSDFNKLASVTASASELNTLSGITATVTELNYVDTTAGTASASKALILDSSRDIININSLTATNLTGTLQTAAQPNITSVGTLTSLSTGSLTLNGTLITSTAADINSISGISTTLAPITGVTAGTASASKALILDSSRDIININSLTATNLTGTLQTVAQPNITSVGTLTSLSTGSLTLNGTLITSTAADINSISGISTTLAPITGVTAGTASASKALILDSSRDIININSLTATNLTGTLQTAAQPNITSVGTLTSLSTGSLTLNGTAITATATELNYNDITTIGTAQASKALIVDANKDIQSIRRLHIDRISIGALDFSGSTRFISAIDSLITNGTNRYLCMGKSYSTYNEAEWGYFHISDGSTSNRQEFGFYGANGIFAITAGRKIGINNTTPNYDLDVTGDINLTGSLLFSGTAITATATDINSISGISTTLAPITGVTGGTASASKALILDSSRDITNINALTATNLTGTLQTAAQPNITSVGTLTSLSTGSLTLNGTAITATAAELNKLSSVTATTSEINYLDITTIGTGEASKAVVLDASRNIININALTATNLTGTLQTAAQTNITSVGTLTGITSSGVVSITDSTSSTSTTTGALKVSGGVGIGGSTNIGGDLRIGSTSNKLILNSSSAYTNATYGTASVSLTSGNVYIKTNNTFNDGSANFDMGLYMESSNASPVGFAFQIHNGAKTTTTNAAFMGTVTNNDYAIMTNNTRRITISSTGNVSINNTNNTYRLDVTGDINLTGSLRFSGTAISATATELNKLSGVTATTAEINYLDITTIGTGEASKAVVLDASRNIININSLTATNLTGTLQTAAQPNITSVGTLTSLSTGSLTLNGTAITATAAELNKLSGVTATTAEINWLDITTIGTGEASKAVILDASRNITNINALTATNLTGTLQTAAQPNITSVGTLTSLSTGSLTLNGTAISATAAELNKLSGVTATTAEINYLDITTIGTGEASKAVVLDASRNIININALTATNLTGTLQTAAQPNITSVGTLTSLSTGSLTLNGTAITATAADINSISGISTTLAPITGVTEGTASASKALILDSSRNIININALTATNLTGTLQTAAQTNITSVGTLTSLTTSGNIITSSANAAFRILPHTDNIIYFQAGLNTTTGSAADIFIGNYLQATSASTRKIMIKADGKIGVGTETPGYTLDVVGDINLTGSLRFSGTAANLTALTGATAGTAVASKALVLDANRDITNINNLTLTGALTVGTVGSGPNKIHFSGTTQDASANHTVIAERIYSGTEQAELLLFKGNDPIAPAGPDRIRMRASEIRFQTYTTAEDFSTIADNNDRLTILSSGNVGIANSAPGYALDVTGDINLTGSLRFGGTAITATAAEINWLDITAAGTAQASKVLVLNASKEIKEITKIQIGTNTTIGQGDLNIMNTAANSRIRFGSSESSGNLVSMQWTYVSADSLTNKFSLDFYGRSNQMAFFNSGNMSLGRASPYAMFDIAGSSNFVTGSYNKMLACFGSNATPVQFDIQCSTGTAATTTNAAWIGTISNSDLRIGTNNSASRMIITAAGNVGIGTTTPGVLCDVAGVGRFTSSTNIPLAVSSSATSECMIALTSTGTSGRTYWLGSSASTSGVTAGSFFVYDQTAAASRFTINSNGYIGMGTNSPGYPLHVNNTTGASYTGSFAFYAINSGLTATTTGVASNPSGVTIFTNGRVLGSEFNATSDSRIKTNIIDIDDVSALNTLRLIQPKKYNYIDTLNRSSNPVWGFIAQQVHSVLDYAVNIETDYIPNIFQTATKTLTENGDTLLTVTNPITFDSHSTNKLKIISENDKYEYVTIKTKISNTQISINETLGDNNYFIYGEQINNLHVLNKDAIFTITTAAVQEIDRNVTELENKVVLLEQKNNQLEQQIQDILSRLQALENA